MRRFLIILSFCMLLCGCTKLPKEQTNQIENTKSSDRIILEDSAHDGCGNSFDNYDEYLDFCADDTVVPVNFVHYEQIAFLGQFQQYESDYWRNDEGKIVAHYTYTLIDEFSRTMKFHGYAYTLENYNERPQYINREDLRSVPGGFSGYRTFVSNNLEYTYRENGQLMDIYWDVSDFGFSLWVDGGFSSFEPNPEGTIVDRLLRLDSAPAALDELVEMISTPHFP